jgi:hypothetical protein
MTRLSRATLLISTSLPLLVAACAPESVNVGDGGMGGTGGARPPACVALETYTATSGAPTLSFANDIFPIISGTGTCGLALACHGTPSVAIDPAMTKTMMLVGDPAAAKAALMTMSVNAPTMANVVAGQVGQSFVAYKLSGATGLSCVTSRCVAGASVGMAMPCGDPMPAIGGTLADADRTKILDWIAQGAAN